jgi:beta-galactosidase
MITHSDTKLIIGKEEYAPYAAEMHYFRIPKRYWSICFERIRRAGFRIISSIVPWNLHEDDSREFDFSGYSDPSKDLIVFVELVREFGFKLMLRPGPWVFSEWDNNGLPRFLEKYPEVFARTKDGELIRSNNRAGVTAGYFPSVGHPRYLNFVRHYFNGLTEIIKNYVYPRGPLFLMELDSQSYFGGNWRPHLADYNEHVVKELYPAWLQTQYGDIKTLCGVYDTKYKDFSEVTPPVEFSDVGKKELARILDWFRFKEYLLTSFLAELREMYKTFSCEPMFFCTLSFRDEYHAPVTGPKLVADGSLHAVNLCWDLTTGENLSRVRHLRTVTEFPYVAEIPVGNWSYSPERSEQYYPIGADATRYMTTVALAGGAKALCYNMFVGRDHWYGSALASDGTIQESYDLIRTFNTNAQNYDIASFRPFTEIGLAAYRPYTWESSLEWTDDRKSLARYLSSTTIPRLARDLDLLKYDFGIPDLSTPSSLDKFGTIIVPVADVMGEHEQTYLLELARKGTNIILIGLLPQVDTSMANCPVLSKALKCKSAPQFALGHIAGGEGHEFTSMVFGSLKTTERRSRRLALSDRKAVAISFSKFKGTVVLISFDPSTESNHQKMAFLEHVLHSCKIRKYVETSNPRIRAVVQKGEAGTLLFLLNSTPQLQFKEGAASPTRTAVRLDVKALGLKGSKIKMVELFTDQVRETTASELSDGLYVTMSGLDGRVYLIPNK